MKRLRFADVLRETFDDDEETVAEEGDKWHAEEEEEEMGAPCSPELAPMETMRAAPPFKRVREAPPEPGLCPLYLGDSLTFTLIICTLRHHTPLLQLLNRRWRRYFERAAVDWDKELVAWCLHGAAETALIRRNFHPRDRHIFFDEELGHRYTLVRWDARARCLRWCTTSGERTALNAKGLISTTTCIGGWYPAFDNTEAIRLGRGGHNRAWYVGKSDEEVIAIWKANSDDASAKGTYMHFIIECYYNGQLHLVDRTTKEWALFEAFEKAYIEGKLRPYRSEMMFYNSKLRICGAVDMLYEYIEDEGRAVLPVQVPCGVDPVSGAVQYRLVMKRRLVMYDWKRSKELKESNPYQSGCVYLTQGSEDTNRNHYDRQLTIYKMMAEAEPGADEDPELDPAYDFVITERYILLLHPQQLAPLRVEVKLGKQEEQAIIGHRLTELHWDNEGARSGLLPPPQPRRYGQAAPGQPQQQQRRKE